MNNISVRLRIKLQKPYYQGTLWINSYTVSDKLNREVDQLYKTLNLDARHTCRYLNHQISLSK